MSHFDRKLSSERSTLKGGEGSDLSLSGSQVSLVLRPRSVTGKASIRALSVSGPRVRRPMSAVPSMSLLDMTRDKRRPYSADGQLLQSSRKPNGLKHSTCFSSGEPLGLIHNDFETDEDIEFSSSTLVSSNMSDHLGVAWMELEMKELYLRNSNTDNHHSFSPDESSDLLCCSDASEEPTRSEKSLGQCIQAMARDHMQYNHLPPQQTTYSTDMGTDCKSERNMKSTDPKNMSTKELHLQMVESGLIPSSLTHSSGTINLSVHGSSGNDTPTFRSQPYSHRELSKELSALQQKNEQQKRKTSELDISDKVETNSHILWNQNDDFYQAGTKAIDEIDQISFPKEHDVDSFEEDFYHDNENLGTQKRKDKLVTSTEVLSVQDNSCFFRWNEGDLMPVRFQQWVTDSNTKDNSIPSRDIVSGDYLSGRRMCQPHYTKDDLDLECTIKDVSTDSECIKEQSSDKAISTVDFIHLEKIPVVSSNITSTLNLPTSDEKCFTEIKTSHEEVSTDCSQISKEGNTCSSKLGQKKVDSENTDNGQLPMSGKTQTEVLNADRVPQKQIQQDSHVNPRLSDFKSNGRKSCVSKKTVGSSRAKTYEFQRNQDEGSQRESKSKFDHKVGTNFGRLRKKPPTTNRNFTTQKEESLPGEPQPELLSWMAMCSDNMGENNVLVEQSTTGEEADSPYNDIMTILRVLEEKEDESSLTRILNKKYQQSTPIRQNASPTFRPSSSDIDSCLPDSNGMLHQNSEGCSSPNSPTSFKTEESQETNCEANKSAGKDAECSSISNPPGVSSANNTAEPKLTGQGELRDLLTFLDAVDRSCSSVLQPNHVSNPRASPLLSDTQNLEELLTLGRSDLAQEIVSLRLALEDRDATINLLRTALREQKDNQSKQNAAHTSELECHMRQVKTESEAIIKRHQKFIDQLIADKASLSERCESLVQEVKISEQKHAKEISSLESKHKVEMQRIKDISAATEKLKRERWVESKTQKIKELTVKGLEPELTRLTAQHEQEMSALRTLHAQELEQMEVRAARRASQQMETLREQLVQEKEEALTKEREILRQRMEKQQILFEEEGAEQRRRLVSEVRREQDRLATLEARLEAQFEEKKRCLERETEQERERMRRDYADKLTEMHRKQQNEILQFREALKAEKESWMETYQQQQKQALTQSTNEIRDQLKRERDREIEVVIERLESEATISREEREKIAENRLRRVREQLTTELKDVESALNSLKDKHTELRSQLQEKEDKLVSSETLNRSLHTQLVETRKIADQLSAERADLKQALRTELSSEIEELHRKMSEQHSRHQQQQKILLEQVERERQTHQQELQQLYDRVKLAIAKKEEVVKVAKAKQKAAEEQNAHLQALLDHRRKESFLS